MKTYLRGRAPWLGALFAAAVMSATPAAQARVARIAIDKVDSPEPGLERIDGRAFGELDPSDAGNAIITDIALAPRNAAGKVEYVSRFTITRPADPAKLSGVLWYDIVNRGAPVTPGEGATRPTDFGHVSLISGWQGDLAQTPKNWAVQVPVAVNPDGSPITGPVMARLADVPAGTKSRPLVMLAAPIPYDAASLETRRAQLITKQSEKRTGEVAGVSEVPSDAWSFGDCSSVPFPGAPNPRMLCLREGFNPALLYELHYEARDPKVLGIGFAAIRDVASFFRYADKDDAGTPNPLAGHIKHAIVQGISQSGNTLKTFLLLGFNRDEGGHIVFDGANPHIAGRLTALNVRFGVPSGSGTLYEPGGEGVLWWTPYQDKARGRVAAGLLDRCTASGTCPKIFETFGSSEFNARLMTVALTGTSGHADLPVPANVRRYYFPGVTHNGDPQGGFQREGRPAPGCVMARNPNPETETMNALQVALVDWVTKGRQPPASIYPTYAAHDLVANTREAMGYPAIPNAPSPTGMAVGLMDYDFGTALAYNDFSGVITRQPPAIRQTIPPAMPRVGADGNELVGLASVLHQAPLGTYTGWNTTAGGFFKGQPCGGGLTGGYVPFAKTRAERTASGDPRPSLEERYGTRAGYMCVVRAAVRAQLAARTLLPRDAERLVARAGKDAPMTGIPETAEGKKIAKKACGG